MVYDGAVYPLRADDTIDVSGPSWEIEDAKRFLLSGATIPFAPGAGAAGSSPYLGASDSWTLEGTQFGYYFLFDAPERVAVATIDRLSAAGVAVQRWDVSHRPAADGSYYDWFARLLSDTTQEELRSQISTALTAAAPAPPTETPGAGLAQLQLRVEMLVAEVAELYAALGVANAQRDSAEARVATETERSARLEADLARSAALYKNLRDEHEALVSQAESAEDEARLRLEKEALIEMALAENADLWSRLQEFEEAQRTGDAKVLILRAEIDELNERLEELGEQERRRARAVRPTVGPQRGVPGFIERSFQRLEFVLDSLDALEDFSNPAAALRVLFQIDTGDMVGKDLEGIRGWREVSKVATGNAGQEDLGRIYYLPGGPRVLVSVHIKQDDKQQQRHIGRLARLA
ncbi:hypothetical protein ACFFGH_28360 [Lysobacter korlensis]|uniref:Uncharacterized protein n=1 Tax=Lysobacter korlensis TaxID=553636 RepID=A0ABV6S0V4_9GAMM